MWYWVSRGPPIPQPFLGVLSILLPVSASERCGGAGSEALWKGVQLVHPCPGDGDSCFVGTVVQYTSSVVLSRL